MCKCVCVGGGGGVRVYSTWYIKQISIVKHPAFVLFVL